MVDAFIEAKKKKQTNILWADGCDVSTVDDGLENTINFRKHQESRRGKRTFKVMVKIKNMFGIPLEESIFVTKVRSR